VQRHIELERRHPLHLGVVGALARLVLRLDKAVGGAGLPHPLLD
jgi:hypothetical protein